MMNTYSEINQSGDVFLSTIEINQDSIDTNKIDDLKKRIIDTKKRVIREVEKLNKLEHMEIFKILRSHNVIYSENVNGIFINLTGIKDETVSDIEKYLEYVCKQEESLTEIEQQKNELTNTFFNDNNKDNIHAEVDCMKKLNVTIGIPAFNEEKNIEML